MKINFDTYKEQPARKPSPERLVFALEMLAKLASSKIEIKGRENLEKIVEGKKVIIACSHISDMDMGMVAYALRNDFDLLITHQSVQTFFTEPGISIGRKLAGSDNFMPIDWQRFEGGKQGKFNPDNFIDIAESVNKSGKTPLVAAHNPSKNWRLERGGYGVAMLAQYEKDAVVLPVAVNVKSEEPVGMAESRIKTIKQKPEVEITIGEPLELPEIKGFEGLKNIIDKRKKGERLSGEERKMFSELHKALEKESDVIMRKIAHYLPEEKRGIYNNSKNDEIRTEQI